LAKGGRSPSPVEIAHLADAIDPRYRARVLVGAYGGLRIGELAGLRRSRVDLTPGTIDVAKIVVEVCGLTSGPPKTRAGRRSVSLPRPVLDELAAHLAPTDEGFVLPSAARRPAQGPRVPPSGVGPGRRRGRPGGRHAPRVTATSSMVTTTVCATASAPCSSPRSPLQTRQISPLRRELG